MSASLLTTESPRILLLDDRPPSVTRVKEKFASYGVDL